MYFQFYIYIYTFYLLISCAGIAFSELIDIIEEVLLASTESTPVFMTKDLRLNYRRILKKLGATDEHISCVNVTRLKEKILEEFPQLWEEKSGKCTILTTSSKRTGKAIYEKSILSGQAEGRTIFKAIKIIRKYMFETDKVFDGDFSEECQLKAVPSHLLLLLGLILEGSKDLNISDTTASVALKLSQLVRFNLVKKKRIGMNFRHSKKSEPPLPVPTGLAVHSQTRGKKIIEKLYSNGLCMSYDRVIEIENNITKDLYQKYKEAEIICPPSLYSGLFTCVAIDNIDNNSSSSTSKSSFHRTSISLFQYPTKQMQKPSLTESYTNILPAKNTKPEPLNRTGTIPCSNTNNLNGIDL